MSEGLVYVRATVTLVGLGPNDPVWVNPEDPQVARWLRGGQLIRLDPETGADVPRETPRRGRRKKAGQS